MTQASKPWWRQGLEAIGNAIGALLLLGLMALAVLPYVLLGGLQSYQ